MRFPHVCAMVAVGVSLTACQQGADKVSSPPTPSPSSESTAVVTKEVASKVCASLLGAVKPTSILYAIDGAAEAAAVAPSAVKAEMGRQCSDDMDAFRRAQTELLGFDPDGPNGAYANDPAVSTRPSASVANVEEALAARLEQVANVLGYGPVQDRQGMAHVMRTEVCEPVASGAKTWADVMREDIDNGAPRDAATRMVEFLETEFCTS